MQEQDCCEARLESLVEASAFESLAVNQDGRVLDAIPFKPFPLIASQNSQLQNSHILTVRQRRGRKNKIYVPATADIFPVPVTESLCCNWEPDYTCSLSTGNVMKVYLTYQVKYGEFSNSESLPQNQ